MILSREGFLKFATFDGDNFVGGLVTHDELSPSRGYIGKAELTTLERIATDPSTAIVVEDFGVLERFVMGLEAAVCNESPPPSPPSPPSPSLPPSPPPPTPPSPSPPPPPPSQSSEFVPVKTQEAPPPYELIGGGVACVAFLLALLVLASRCHLL